MTTAMHPQAGHVPTRRLVLADLIPNMRLRSAALVVAGALLTAAASQVRIPLGFTPVPINLATFAAALTGGALGMRRGVASMTLYLLAGIVGLPFFAGGTSGWSIVSGATGGYLVCYPVMAAIVGWAAQRGHDRRVGSFVAAVVAANAVLYLVGALWLGHVVGLPLFAGSPFGGGRSAFALGVRPFLAGDVVKMVVAGLLFPAAWRAIGDR